MEKIPLLVALVLVPGCHSPGRIQGAIDFDGASRLVLGLPEIAAWIRMLDAAGPETRFHLRADAGPSDGGEGWIFYVGEDRGSHTALWKHVKVSARTGEIQVWSGDLDSFIALDRWRSLAGGAHGAGGQD